MYNLTDLCIKCFRSNQEMIQTSVIMQVYYFFRRKRYLQRQRIGSLEESSNSNTYGAANKKFKRMFKLVYESNRSKNDNPRLHYW